VAGVMINRSHAHAHVTGGRVNGGCGRRREDLSRAEGEPTTFDADAQENPRSGHGLANSAAPRSTIDPQGLGTSAMTKHWVVCAVDLIHETRTEQAVARRARCGRNRRRDTGGA
jgi:hypothetical protein